MVRVKLPALQMKEHCAMVGTRFMWAPETCCQIRPGARSLGESSKQYMIHCLRGHSLRPKGEGLRYMIGGSLLAHYCRRAVALMHAANAAAKLGGTASPMRGKRRSWPELVVDLHDQGTGVLRAVALGRRWGGSLDLRSESY